MRSILLTLLFAALVPAQVDTGGISGGVSGTSGAVIPGVRVEIVQQGTNAQFAAATNGSGFYAAPALRPGTYFLTVTKEGFRVEKRTGVELRV